MTTDVLPSATIDSPAPKVPTVDPAFKPVTLSMSDGRHADARWRVSVFRPGPDGVIRRKVHVDNVPEHRWRDDHAVEVIWPSWSELEYGSVPGAMTGDSALDRAHDYWSQATDRIRDSAKWLAAILGVTTGAIVGTSPLSGLRDQQVSPVSLLLGALGLALLGGTMFLVLKILRPRFTSFEDVQAARPPVGGWLRRRLQDRSLGRWREVVESEQDLYLPYGVRDLTGLRQEMLVDKLTLQALCVAIHSSGVPHLEELRSAQAAQARRLQELRDAAARIARVGEFYQLCQFSASASVAGGLLGTAGTVALVAAFAWPLA